MQRRNFLKSAAITVFGAGFPVSGVMAQNRYAKYAGQTVTMSIPAHAQYDAMVSLLPQFTKSTGIKVETEKVAVSRLKDKQLLEMAKSQGDYDLSAYVVMWKSEYVAKRLIQPLAPFFANPALADPTYDLDDIIPIYLENIGMVGGPKGYLKGPGASLYGLPYGAETSILAYRRDIFEEHKLQVPNNYVEFSKLLRTIKDKAGIGALTSRGQVGHQAVHAWLLHLNPLGGRIFDDQWKPTFNDQYGIGKVGYALHPMGARRASEAGGAGLAIAQNSKNPDAAFLLLQWLTSKAQDKAVTRLGGSPLRSSTLADADMLRQYPEFSVFQEALKFANPDWRPIIPEWDRINAQALGVGISEALTGKKTAEAALSGLIPQVTQIMREGGYKI